MIEDQASEK
jgi:tRNA(Ser,Leu) C12 N-acetylase TAN1